MTIYYDTKNKVKPRYDGSGTEFGLMHRNLGPGFLMFDIDKMSVTLEINLELQSENEAFIEYRQNKKEIDFVALFEVKYKKTKYSVQAINPYKSNSIARLEIAKRLDCRLFVVFATDGKQPFDFYEYDNNHFKNIGTLTYADGNKETATKNFWKYVLKIDR